MQYTQTCSEQNDVETMLGDLLIQLPRYLSHAYFAYESTS